MTTSDRISETGIPSTIRPLTFDRTTRYAENNGATVTTAVDLPVSVLAALAALVDAVQTEFGDATAARYADPDAPRALCRYHVGQLAEFCGPCRSEQIAARTAP